MKSVVHGLEAQYQGRVNFVYLDIDNPATQDLKRTLGFRSQPQFFLLDGDGKVLKQWVGLVEATTFHAAFERAARK